jgi:hypothetical protein
LEIWEKLPDCATKDKLFDRLSTRVWIMSNETSPNYSWLGYALAISWVAFTSALLLIDRGVSFHRDKEGALWASGAGYHLPFTTAAYIVLGYVAVNVLCGVFGTWGARKFDNWQNTKAGQQKTPVAETANQNA